MLKFLKTAVLSAALGLGITAALPAAANADGLYFGFGNDGPSFGVIPADNGRWDRHRGGNRDDERNRRHERRGDDGWRRDRGPGCTPDRALDKAERLGLRRAFIRDVGRNTIHVSGRRYGERMTVIFARAPHCPVVSF